MLLRSGEGTRRRVDLCMRRATILTVAAVLLAAVIGGFAWFQFIVKPEMIRRFTAAAPHTSPAVTAAPAREARWEPRLPTNGSMRAVRGIVAAPPVAGLGSAPQTYARR